MEEMVRNILKTSETIEDIWDKCKNQVISQYCIRNMSLEELISKTKKISSLNVLYTIDKKSATLVWMNLKPYEKIDRIKSFSDLSDVFDWEENELEKMKLLKNIPSEDIKSMITNKKKLFEILEVGNLAFKIELLNKMNIDDIGRYIEDVQDFIFFYNIEFDKKNILVNKYVENKLAYLLENKNDLEDVFNSLRNKRDKINLLNSLNRIYSRYDLELIDENVLEIFKELVELNIKSENDLNFIVSFGRISILKYIRDIETILLINDLKIDDGYKKYILNSLDEKIIINSIKNTNDLKMFMAIPTVYMDKKVLILETIIDNKLNELLETVEDMEFLKELDIPKDKMDYFYEEFYNRYIETLDKKKNISLILNSDIDEKRKIQFMNICPINIIINSINSMEDILMLTNIKFDYEKKKTILNLKNGEFIELHRKKIKELKIKGWKYDKEEMKNIYSKCTEIMDELAELGVDRKVTIYKIKEILKTIPQEKKKFFYENLFEIYNDSLEYNVKVKNKYFYKEFRKLDIEFFIGEEVRAQKKNNRVPQMLIQKEKNKEPGIDRGV